MNEDGKLIKLLSDSLNINTDLNDDEKNNLIIAYRTGDLDDYYSQVIKRVIARKSFSLDDEQASNILLPILKKIDASKVGLDTDDDITKWIEIVFKTLMIVDISAADSKES